MQFFPLIDFQHWVLALFLGFIAVILIYLSMGSHPRSSARKSSPDEEKVLFDEAPEKNPIPPVLIFVFVGTAIFALGYFWLIGIQGPPF